MKDPTYDDTRYVVDPVTDGVVNTMPEATLDTVADHGRLHGDTVRGTYADARQTLDSLTSVGIDYTDVVHVLEDEGAAKFEESWAHLADQLTHRMRSPYPRQQAEPAAPVRTAEEAVTP